MMNRALAVATCSLAGLLILACGGGDFSFEDLDGAGAPPASPRLDAFFAGIEKGCEGNPAFNSMIGSLAIETADGRWAAAPSAQLPAEVASMFGKPKLAHAEEEYSTLALPVEGGTWQGLEVLRVEHNRGHFNGINGHALIVRGDPAEVEAHLRGRLTITDSCADDPDCPMDPTVMTFVPHEGNTAIVCDFSM